MPHLMFNHWHGDDGRFTDSEGDTTSAGAKAKLKALQDPPMSLNAFARSVDQAVKHSPTGRLFDTKVFINHAYQQFQKEPHVPKMSESDFKNRLIDAHRAGLIEMSRLDIPSLGSKEDVQQSAVHHLGAEFNLIRVK